MTPQEFCYWLQGYFEITREDNSSSAKGLTVDQMRVLKNHLALVFKHSIDPQAGNEAVQNVLNDIHSENKPGVTRPPSKPVTYRC